MITTECKSPQKIEYAYYENIYVVLVTDNTDFTFVVW